MSFFLGDQLTSSFSLTITKHHVLAPKQIHNRSLHPLRRLCPSRRRSPKRPSRRSRRHPLRRHGQSLRSQSNHRSHGLQGLTRSRHHGSHRCALNGITCRLANYRIHQGRCKSYNIPPRGFQSCRSILATD